MDPTTCVPKLFISIKHAPKFFNNMLHGNLNLLREKIFFFNTDGSACKTYFLSFVTSESVSAILSCVCTRSHNGTVTLLPVGMTSFQFRCDVLTSYMTSFQVLSGGLPIGAFLRTRDRFSPYCPLESKFWFDIVFPRKYSLSSS